MKIELIYYQLCSSNEYYKRIKEAQQYHDKGIPLTEDLLSSISIELNNRKFCDELDEQIKKGYDHLDYWLRGLISNYVKRKSKQNGDTTYNFEYYKSWLENTKLLLKWKIPYIEEWCNDYETLIKEQKAMEQNITGDKSKVFIVHGHDDGAKETVARFVEKIGCESIILHEKSNKGKTIIEKLEEYTNVAFAIVIYTPCDKGGENKENATLNQRARQNVVFEHGFLSGKLGRSHVCALIKGNIDIPSDITGMVYIQMNENDAWKNDLIKEMRECGCQVDINRLLD